MAPPARILPHPRSFAEGAQIQTLKACPSLADPPSVSSWRNRTLSLFSRPLWVATTLTGTAVAGDAIAAPVAESMRASANADGYLSTESSQVLPAWTPSATLITGWGRFGGNADLSDRWSIDSRMTTHVLAGIGLFDHAQLDLDLPMILHQSGSADVGQSSFEPAAFGDLRASLKGTILHAKRRGLGVGAGLDLYFPTGSSSALAGLDRVAFGINAMAEYRAYRGFSGALNLGYLARPDREGDEISGDLLTYRLAGRAPFGPHSQFAAIVELDGGIHLKANAKSPLVARGGLDWAFESGIRIGVFGGGGLSTRLGVPNVQALFRVAYIPPGRLRKERAFVGAPRPGARALVRQKDQMLGLTKVAQRRAPSPEDPDADGLLASADRCPNVPEDLDRFADEDGCPEPDNDRDSFADGLDLCPNEPEVTNGYADNDGCPDVIIAGEGRTVTRLQDALRFPEVTWVGPSAKLTQEAETQLEHFVELVLLNPWLAPIEVRIDGPDKTKLAKFGHIDADDITMQRAQTLAHWFASHKLDPWRVFVAGQRAATPDKVEFVMHKPSPSHGTRLGGLAPIAASPSLMQAKFLQSAKEQKKPKLYEAQGPGPKDAAPKAPTSTPSQTKPEGKQNGKGKDASKNSGQQAPGAGSKPEGKQSGKGKDAGKDSGKQAPGAGSPGQDRSKTKRKSGKQAKQHSAKDAAKPARKGREQNSGSRSKEGERSGAAKSSDKAAKGGKGKKEHE